MKRKAQPKLEPVIDPEILESAKRSLITDRLKPPVKCVVCGGEASIAGEAAIVGDEQLCWVCRRLKISAWRDVEAQMPAQE